METYAVRIQSSTPRFDSKAVAGATDVDAEKSYSCSSPFTIHGNGETFLNYERVLLLEKIRDAGAIPKAASELSISYRHAWDLVCSMNAQAARPVVENAAGGTTLTAEGERMIRVYRALLARHQEFIEKLQPELETIMGLTGHEPEMAQA